jgi:hypothetical protein
LPSKSTDLSLTPPTPPPPSSGPTP